MTSNSVKSEETMRIGELKWHRLRRGGVECDENGLRINDTELLERGETGDWSVRDEKTLSSELSRLFGARIHAANKLEGLSAVARALNDGSVAKAQITTLLLRLPEPPSLVVESASRGKLLDDLIGCGLVKANDNFDELHPRTGTPPNPGWFATKPEGEQGGHPSENQRPSIDNAAYQGDFHDQVLQDEIELYRKVSSCVSEVRLSLGEVTSRLDILCRGQSGVLLGADIKTGDNPQLTPSQVIVYGHAIVGGLTSPDPKVAQLGFAPNAPLPPIEIFIVYVAAPGATKRYFGPL